MVVVTDLRYETQVADEIGDFAEVLIETTSCGPDCGRLPRLQTVEIVGFESHDGASRFSAG